MSLPQPKCMLFAFLVLIAAFALPGPPAPVSAFVGTWELVSLSQLGRPRPGQGRLIVAPGPRGRADRWTWDLAHQPRVGPVTTLKPGKPWPIISRHWPGGRIELASMRGEEGFYRLDGDTLTVVIEHPRPSIEPVADIFQPASGRTIETYRRVRREPDFSFLPARFPKGPAVPIVTWDEAGRGVLQGPPSGVLDHYAAYDLGDGVHMVYRRGSEFLDDPPAPDLDPKDVPTGSIVRPPGGKFDDRTYEIAYPDPSPSARAVIDAFRTQNPDVPSRRWTHHALVPKSTIPEYQFFGWDGILLSAQTDGDRTIADVLFRPRVLGLSSFGYRTLLNCSPPLLETWEFRAGKLRYVSGGPELADEGPIGRSPIWPDPGRPPIVASAPPVRPRPPTLPPVDHAPTYPLAIHYRPCRLDLTDSTGNSTEGEAPPASSPEFTIHHAFQMVASMPPPEARRAFFAEVLKPPGRYQARWDAVIKSAVPEGNEIRAEILVWPQVDVLEHERFRALPVRPFLETWLYKEHRLRFISGRSASQGRKPTYRGPLLGSSGAIGWQIGQR